jgi:hypothetical protein
MEELLLLLCLPLGSLQNSENNGFISGDRADILPKE